MRFLLLFVAAVIAVFAGVAALQLSNKNSAPTSEVVTADHSQSVNTVGILVARAPLAAGTVITQDMLDTQPWPENLVLKGFIVAGSIDANIVGRVTRAPLQAREPFISDKLANTSEAGFLAARLPTGTRAVTIATDAVSGVAGFVFPGDRIDVLFTHNIPHQLKGSVSNDELKGSSDKPAYSEILVANAPVLAVNLRDPNNKEPGQGAGTSISPSSITLQVKDVDAENIRLAEKVGTLSVSLRSIRDMELPTETPPADLSGLTHIHLSDAPLAEDNSVKVIKR